MKSYHISIKRTYLTDPDIIILLSGAESSIKVNPTNALSKDPKYASRTSGETVLNIQKINKNGIYQRD